MNHSLVGIWRDEVQCLISEKSCVFLVHSLFLFEFERASIVEPGSGVETMVIEARALGLKISDLALVVIGWRERNRSEKNRGRGNRMSGRELGREGNRRGGGS